MTWSDEFWESVYRGRRYLWLLLVLLLFLLLLTGYSFAFGAGMGAGTRVVLVLDVALVGAVGAVAVALFWYSGARHDRRA